MAKRDFIYDTKGGRISLAIIAVFLLVMGIVLVVLSILLGRADKDGFWQTFILGTASIIYGVYNLIVLKKRSPRVLPDDTADVPETVTVPTRLPQEPDCRQSDQGQRARRIHPAIPEGGRSRVR